ncbi:MAG: M15 family metallopeptidase [Treponemataceae bacterium]
MNRLAVCTIILLYYGSTIFSQTASLPILHLRTIKKAYPEVQIESEFDKTFNDWKISVTNNAKTTILYWAEGRLLPYDQLKNKEKFRVMLYNYAKNIPDPATLTTKEIERIRGFSSSEKRTQGSVTPPFFYDAIYNSTTRPEVESHLVQSSFLGKHVRVHSFIQKKLATIERRILTLSKVNMQVGEFIQNLDIIDGYLWRQIRDTQGKSFHSFGIAIDILPKDRNNKIIYWAWHKQNNPDNWMLTPLSKRWMPPLEVIEIFEDEGFIWGGKWAIWDNMHFEYHPELLVHQRHSE